MVDNKCKCIRKKWEIEKSVLQEEGLVLNLQVQGGTSIKVGRGWKEGSIVSERTGPQGKISERLTVLYITFTLKITGDLGHVI